MFTFRGQSRVVLLIAASVPDPPGLSKPIVASQHELSSFPTHSIVF